MVVLLVALLIACHACVFVDLCFLGIRRPPRSTRTDTLCPYTTLFRSLEKSARPAEKIRISGGGRCNFTNLHCSPANFLSQNPRFCVSALKRYTQQDFIARVDAAGIAWHEKTLGQLFCDGASQQIIDMLLADCAAAAVTLMAETTVSPVQKRGERFHLPTSRGHGG